MRNISNQLTIRTKIDLMSEDLKDYAQNQGWWKPSDGDLDFAAVFSDSLEETELTKGNTPSTRLLWGTKLLKEYSEGGRGSSLTC